MYSVTMKKKYQQTGKTLQPCCDMFIPFGFQTHFLSIPLGYTVMCISCRRKAKGRTLEKTIDKWNSKITKQND